MLPQDPEESSPEPESSVAAVSSSASPSSASSDQQMGHVIRSLGEDRVERELWRTLEPGSGFVPMAAGPSFFPVRILGATGE